MSRLAILKDNVVANVIVGELADWPDAIDVTDRRVGPGYTYEPGTDTFTPPLSSAAPTLSRLDFRDRFTLAEKEAIYTAAETTVSIRVWLDDLAAATDVRLDDPRTIDAVRGLEAAGLIGAGRADEILGVA